MNLFSSLQRSLEVDHAAQMQNVFFQNFQPSFLFNMAL